MFTDESLEPVTIESHAKQEIYIRDQLCQTKTIKNEEKGCQAISYNNAEVQTDFEKELPQSTRMRIDNSKDLSDFMLSVYPVMSEQLIANIRSHSFDGYEVDWEDVEGDDEEINCFHSLRDASNNTGKVTSLSWNSTGSVIAAALGSFDHESWCTHQSFIYFWNINRSSLNANKPDTVIDSDTCVMDIAFHPKQPALLAGGNFTGKLIIWDMSNEENVVAAQSGKGTTHQEPISKIIWKKPMKGRVYELVSVGFDGRILVWEFNELRKELQLVSKFLFRSNSVQRGLKNHALKSDVEIGISCISLQYNNQDVMFVGGENGGVFKCILDATKCRKIKSDHKDTFLSPLTKTFDGHMATVSSVDSSCFFEEIFLTCASDMTIHIYNVQQIKPLIIIEPILEYLHCAQWSPRRPAVFYVATSKGKMLIFDLSVNTVTPISMITVQDDDVPIQRLAYNCSQSNIIATGDDMGMIKVWNLPFHFIQEKQSERIYFDKMKESEF